MRIVFITNSIDAPASNLYWNALKQIKEIDLCTSKTDLNNYDIALLMTYEHSFIDHIKRINKNIKVGIIDPRNSLVKESAKKADFLIVDSIEMEDYWREVDKPIFNYKEFPNIKPNNKIHLKKEVIKIGYHGNITHLREMTDTVTVAINNLSKKYNLEFLVMTGQRNLINENIDKKWIPNINTTIIPWSFDNYNNYLSTCDIGIAPSLIPTDSIKHEVKNDDYILRFKTSSNPGRIIVFGILGIPTVTSFYPSGVDISSNNRGLIANSAKGWEMQLEKLIKDSTLRQSLSDNLQDYVKKNYDFTIQNQKLLNFLKDYIF